MNEQEVAAVVDGIVPVFKDHIQKQVEPLSERIQAVEDMAVSKSAAEAMMEDAFSDLSDVLVKLFTTAEAVRV